MSLINHWPKDRAGVARHIYDLHPRQDRAALMDWIDSLDASFGFMVTEHDGNTYLKCHDVTVQVDESPAVIELLRLWAENEVSPTPRNSLIRIDPEADTETKIRKFLPGDPDAQPVAASPELKQPLTERDRELLLFMFDNGHDGKRPIAKAELARELTRGGHKSITDHLRAEGLVDGKPGVGTWLTDKGRRMAELIKKNELY